MTATKQTYYKKKQTDKKAHSISKCPIQNLFQFFKDIKTAIPLKFHRF